MIHCAPAPHSRLVLWHRRYPALRRRGLSNLSNSALRYRDPRLHRRGLVPYRVPWLRRQPHRRLGRILARRRGSRLQEGADRC